MRGDKLSLDIDVKGAVDDFYRRQSGKMGAAIL